MTKIKSTEIQPDHNKTTNIHKKFKKLNHKLPNKKPRVDQRT